MPRNSDDARDATEVIVREQAALADSRRRKNPHAVALGKRGGQVSTAAKRRAAKENGKKGGRPRSAPRLRP